MIVHVIKRDAFGAVLDNQAGSRYNMFTGKPEITGLGYAFLFRNYRGDLGKWQTQDPIGIIIATEPEFASKDTPETYELGYPDGWNNLA